MGRFMKGDVIVLPFPFSHLTTSKKRPAIVVAPLTDDILVCQVTWKAVSDNYAIPIAHADFAMARLRQQSNARPNRLFTADSGIVLYRAARLTSQKMAEVTAKIIEIVTE